MVHFGCALSLVICAAVGAPGESAPREGARAPKVDLDWRSLNRCGPNSLYVFLEMSGKKVLYDSLVEKMHLTERGANVADLVRCAHEYGLDLTPLKASASALDDLPLPAIVHFNIAGDDKGHFLLLLKRTKNDDFATVECTVGEIKIIPRGTFLDRWSGVILVRSDQLRDSRVDYALIASSAAILVLIPTCIFSCWNSKKITRDVACPA